MAYRSEVDIFLQDFHQKLRVYDIRFRDDRGKNLQTLLALEITPSFRKSIIESLTANDYVEGPFEDTLNNSTPLWVFGREIKRREVYIKISIGPPSRPVICISFHEAKHAMKYPFK